MEKRISLLLLWLATCCSYALAETRRSDVSALNGLKATWNSPNQLQSWFGDPCNDKWLGVICNGLQPYERVISLDLSFMNLEGELSSLFAELSSLETLHLSGNKFRGELPPSLGKLTALRHLHLDGNSLSGNVPTEMGYLVNLQSLTLSGNQLSGDVLEAVKHLPRLSHLNYAEHKGDSVDSTHQESMVASDSFVKLFTPRVVERRMNLQVAPGAFPIASVAPTIVSMPPIATPRQTPPPQSAPTPKAPLPKSPPLAKAPAPAPALMAPAHSPPSRPPLNHAPVPAPRSPAKVPGHSPQKAPAQAPSHPPSYLRPGPAPHRSSPPLVSPRSSPPAQPPVLPPIGAPPPNSLRSPNPPAYTTPIAPPPPSPPPPCPTCSAVGQLALPVTCQCVYPLLVNFKLSMNFTNFTAAAEKTFLTQLATSFQASPAQLLLLQAKAGSVYANVALVPLPPATQLNSSDVVTAVSVLQALNGSSLQLDPQFGTVSVLSLTQPFAVAGLPSVIPSPPPPAAAKSSRFPTAAIIGIAIGAAVLAFIVVLLIFCFCCCCNRKRRPPPVPDAGKDYAPRRASLAAAAEASLAPAAPAVGGGWATSAAGNGRGGGSGTFRDSRDASPATVASIPLISRREERNAPAMTTAPRGISPRGNSPGMGGGISPGAALAAGAVGGGVAAVSRGGLTSPGSRKQPLIVPGAQEFTVADLQQATNSFAQDNKVAEGPLGSSYRADFAQGRALAIQRMEPSVVYGLSNEDFKAIVANIARLRHPNVVELHGYCIDYGERLLAFQYFSNKTLFDFLHDPSKQSVMTWETRIRIAIGAARALEYMHEQVAPAVVHRNIKSTIIHLDRDLSPHLADCGMAIFNPMEDNAIQGTGGFNYSAPEYSMTGVYTVKSDVYSFGIVLLELLTGRVPTDLSQPKSEQSLVKWAAPLLHDLNELERMIDPQLAGGRPDATPLTRFAEVITRCVQPEPEFRPPMSKVVQDLVKRVSKSRRGGTDGSSPGDASFQDSPGGWA